MARPPVIRYQTATPEVREWLLVKYHRFLWSLVKRAIQRKGSWRNFEEEDLYQEAALLLFDTWERFNPAREFEFLTYATWRMRYKLDSLAETGGLIRCPNHPGRTSSEYAARAEVVTHFSAMEGDDGTPIRQLAGPAPRKLSHEVEVEAVLEALQTLSAGQRDLVERRFGLRDGRPRTLNEVGKVLSCTRENVRQIEALALAKVRERATRLIQEREPESEFLREQSA